MLLFEKENEMVRRKEKKMAERKFDFRLNKNIGSAGDELRKVEAKKDFDFRIIPRDKISPNPKNDYPMEDIEKLYKSIKRLNKLLTPLTVKPVEEGFLIIAGERRYRAITMGIEKGDPEFDKFKVGLPCMVEDKTLDELDEEIHIITENEERREPNESRKRKMIARLEELYRMKNMSTGENKSIPKQIAETMGISERTTQRYNAINNKLIPELQDAFDRSKINLVKAAQFAAMSEEEQKAIAELLEEKDKLSNSEIEALIKQAKEKENQLAEKALAEAKKAADLQEKLRIAESILKEKEDLENSLKEDIKKELQRKNPNQEKIEYLENQIETLLNEKEESIREKEEIEKKLMQKDELINNLKKKKNSLKLSPEEKEKIKADYEIKSIIDGITKQLKQLENIGKEYIKKYGEPIKELSTIEENISKILKELLANNK